MPTPFLIAIAGIVFYGVFDWFARLERRGQRHTVFVVLVVVLLVESVLAGQAARVPPGLMRPVLFGQDFRPPDFVIVAALAARLVSRPSGRLHIPKGMLPWSAFACWYAAAVVMGLLGPYPVGEVLYQGKTLFYVLGGLLVGAGADFGRLAKQLRPTALVLAGVTILALVLDAVGLVFDLSTPVQQFRQLGRLSNDSVTILTIIGGFVLLGELVRRPYRRTVVGAAMVLLMAPLAGSQRASYIVLAGMLVGIGIAAAGATWRRRSRVTHTELALAGGALVLAAALAFTVSGSPAVVTSRLDAAFGGTAETNSAVARVGMAGDALDRIAEHPFIGAGVGARVTGYAIASDETYEAAAHNIVLDLTLRAGLIGMVLFTAAVATTVRHGLRRWGSEVEDHVAALCLAAVLGLLGILEKGMVEPALDKFRLSLTFGLCAGLVLLAGRQREADGWTGGREDPSDQPAVPVPTREVRR